MRKIAIMSDVHGNVSALKAVIKDAKDLGCTNYWLLGDLFLPGPGTEELLTILDELPIESYVCGNWETHLLRGMDAPINVKNPIQVYHAILADYFRRGLSNESLNRLRRLPMSQSKGVDGIKYQLTHNQPENNHGDALVPTENQAAFDELANNDADIMIYGHTHQQLLRQSSQGKLILNPGTVGMPVPQWEHFSSDLRAQYAVISIDEAGAIPNIEFRRVTYDVEAELALAQSKELPYFELYAEQLHTGVAHTRDVDHLRMINSQPEYRRMLAAILTRIRKIVEHR